MVGTYRNIVVAKMVAAETWTIKREVISLIGLSGSSRKKNRRFPKAGFLQTVEFIFQPKPLNTIFLLTPH